MEQEVLVEEEDGMGKEEEEDVMGKEEEDVKVSESAPEAYGVAPVRLAEHRELNLADGEGGREEGGLPPEGVVGLLRGEAGLCLERAQQAEGHDERG